jgi:hypothetical protein
MTSSDQFQAFAAVRGDGLHPKLHELMLRAAVSPFSEVAVRRDGMLQAGPDPTSETRASFDSVTPFQKQEADCATQPSD